MNLTSYKSGVRTRRLQGLCLLFVCLTLAAGCGTGDKSADAAKGPAGGGRPPARVYVETAQVREIVPNTVVVGTVIPKRKSVVASGADGKVNKFLVREGDIVEEGAELSILNMVTTTLGIEEAEQVLEMRQQEFDELEAGSRSEEKRKAQAELAAAKAAMDVAAAKFKRQEELRQQQAANQDDYDTARERFTSTAAMYDAARAAADLIDAGPRQEAINQAKAAKVAQEKQVEYLKAERDKRTTKSPFRGIVVEEHTEAGQWLSKGASVVTIADMLDEVYIIANVDQSEIKNVIDGSTVDVEIDSSGNTKLQGTVDAVVPRSDWQVGSRTFPVKVVVKNKLVKTADGRQRPMLAEGMYARVSFTGQPREALLAPKNAIIRSENGSRVVIVLPGETPGTGTAKLVMLKEGASYGEYVEVLESELTEGMTIVVEGAERLTPFQPVQIVDPEVESPGAAKKPNSVSEESD